MKKETIVFVHGAWHGKWCWDKYFRKEFTAKGYDVITFDLPGHDKKGRIKGINNYSFKDYVNSLKKEVHKLEKSPILIGHSMGGLIVQKYLEEHTCEKAILLASVPPYGVINTTLRFARKSYFYQSLLGLNLYGLVNTEQKSKAAFFSNDISDKALTEYTSYLCSESFKAFVGMLFPRIRKTKHSDIPMLVIGAKDDTIFTVDDNIKTSEKYNAELLIMENTAHDMMLDVNHEKVSEEIMNWLGKEPKMQSTQRVNT